MKSAFLLVVCLLFVVSARVQAQDNWFDMENCEICQALSENPDVMEHLKFDIKTIDNGMVMVMAIPEEHKAMLDEAHAKMKEAAENIDADSQLCGFCKSYSALMESGAKIEELDTVVGQITLVTSDDASVVAKIHEHAKRSQVEHEKMMKKMSGGR